MTTTERQTVRAVRATLFAVAQAGTLGRLLTRFPLRQSVELRWGRAASYAGSTFTPFDRRRKYRITLGAKAEAWKLLHEFAHILNHERAVRERNLFEYRAHGREFYLELKRIARAIHGPAGLRAYPWLEECVGIYMLAVRDGYVRVSKNTFKPGQMVSFVGRPRSTEAPRRIVGVITKVNRTRCYVRSGRVEWSCRMDAGLKLVR